MLAVKGVLGLFAGVMALTAAVTLLIPETRGRSIEEIEQGVLYGESVSASDTSVSSVDVIAKSDNVKINTMDETKRQETV